MNEEILKLAEKCGFQNIVDLDKEMMMLLESFYRAAYNAEVREPLAGEASSAEGATSAVVLERGQQRRQ